MPEFIDPRDVDIPQDYDGPDVEPLVTVALADLVLATAPPPPGQFFGSWR